MSRLVTFQRWLIIDWADNSDVAWIQGAETAQRFLVITPDARRWEKSLQPITFSPNDFVLVMLLTAERPLVPSDVDLSILFPADLTIPIWCHYGGDVHLRRLADEWRRVRLLDSSLRERLMHNLPAPYRCPMPFSRHIDFGWQPLWRDVERCIRTYKADQWEALLQRLTEAWGAAVDVFDGHDARVMLAMWLGARNACQRILWHFPADLQNASADQVALLLEEVRVLRVSKLRPSPRQSTAENRPKGKKVTRSNEIKLAAAFDRVLNAASNAVAHRQHSSRIPADLKALRDSLVAFVASYDAEIEDARRSGPK